MLCIGLRLNRLFDYVITAEYRLDADHSRYPVVSRSYVCDIIAFVS